MESSGMNESPAVWYVGHHDTGRVDPVGDDVLHQAQDANVCLLKLIGSAKLTDTAI
jgi:hypothetical protein